MFKELTLEKPRPRFTVGIFDDVTQLSLPLTEETIPQKATLEALFLASAVTAPCLPPKTI